MTVDDGIRSTLKVHPYFTLCYLISLLTVLFEVELLNFIDHKAADDFDAFTEVSRYNNNNNSNYNNNNNNNNNKYSNNKNIY